MQFRLKLLISYLVLLLVTLAVFQLWTESWQRAYYLSTLESQLESQLKSLVPLLDPSDPEIDSRVDAAARDPARRITLIADDGRVIADSSFSGADLRNMENHSNRDEVIEARQHGWGRSQRFSTSIGEELLYLAARLPGGQGVLRLSTPVAGYQSQISELRWAMLTRALILTVLGALIALWVARWQSRSIEKLEAAASRIAQGDFQTPLDIASRDQFGPLAENMRQMASQIGELVRNLKAERDFQNAVLRSLGEGVLVADPEGRIKEVNPAFLQIFELDQPPLGKLLIEVIRQTAIAERINQALRGGHSLSDEIEFGDKTLLVRFTPMEAGESAVVVVFHDISELRRLEKVRKDFVANVSHELRTPLTSIQGYSETLLDSGEFSDQQQNFLEKIHSNALNLSEIVNALLELSRIEGERLSLELEDVSVAELLNELDRLFRQPAEEKGLRFYIINDLGPGTLRASSSLLRRALFNLLDNSVKFTQQGDVRLSVYSGPELVVFEVSDTGIGIHETEHNRVFERFYRTDQNLKKEGSGVGLSLVKHIVRLHGGEVQLESRVGKGTRVALTIPT